MKKLLLSLCLLPCLASAQSGAFCDAYIEDRALGDGTHRYASRREIVMPVAGDLLQRMALYCEMEDYQRSFRIHLRTVQGANYMGGARNMIFVFGDDTRMDYPLTLKRTNGDWIAEFAGRAPETELLAALRSKPLKAIRLTTPLGTDETHILSLPERYVDFFMHSVDCIAGMMR